MHSKKGFVEIQFNWIFVLISGAIILIIFTGIIINQKDISQTSIDVLILKNLDAVLSGSESSTGTVNVFSVPNTKINFGCNGYSIGGVAEQSNINIFAPSFLEGDSIVSMTAGWNVPYKVTNLVYVTNTKIRYIFIGSSDFAKDIFEMIPDEIRNDGYTNVDVIENENDDHSRIIFFDQDPEFPVNLYGTSVTALKVSGDENKGTVEFFDSVDNEFVNEGTSYYIGESTLLGAVFSDNLDSYSCVMENVFEKLNAVSQVYERKINNLRSIYEDQQCGEFYDPGSITSIKEASTTFNQLNIDRIAANANNLELQNKQLQSISCVMIY